MTKYWYNTKTGEVEKGKQSIAQYLIGPFDTEAEAAQAWDRVRERSAAWEAEDEAEYLGEEWDGTVDGQDNQAEEHSAAGAVGGLGEAILKEFGLNSEESGDDPSKES